MLIDLTSYLARLAIVSLVQRLHDDDILHRDISASNILHRHEPSVSKFWINLKFFLIDFERSITRNEYLKAGYTADDWEKACANEIRDLRSLIGLPIE